jgi:membrane protein DedA with SNARE-associated domain
MPLADPLVLLEMLAAQPALFFGAVVLLSLLLEDATALAAGVLAGRMQVDPVLALAAVMAGTIGGDLLLYGAGRLAGRWAVVERWVRQGGKLSEVGRSPALVAAARFVPGLRFPAYTGSGLAGMSPLVFCGIVLGTGLVWTPFLFHAGRHVMSAEAGIGLALVAVLLLLLPHLLKGPLRRLLARRTSVGAVAA